MQLFSVFLFDRFVFVRLVLKPHSTQCIGMEQAYRLEDCIYKTEPNFNIKKQIFRLLDKVSSSPDESEFQMCELIYF